MIDNKLILQDVEQAWEKDLVKEISEYIKIPNKSPAFDAQWQEHGHMAAAVDHVVKWCRRQAIKGMQVEVHTLAERTPLITVTIPGQSERTVMLYGHIDKQPEMKGWDADKGPWQPVRQGDKLYGRGGADDGYAVYASLTAIATLQRHGLAHHRCVVVIEASEESGSPDLPFYLDHLADKIGSPELVICLDSGCGNYDTLWSTTSLRGLVGADVHIRTLSAGIHSGKGSGVVPSWYTVLLQLISRIVDPQSGAVALSELQAKIPSQHQSQAAVAAKILGQQFIADYPFLAGVEPVSQNVEELLLNQSWRTALSITGLEGLPSLKDAGNVTLPEVSVKLSLRVPPNCDGETAAGAIKRTLETAPPYGAEVRVRKIEWGNGWVAPPLADWLREATDTASQAFFGEQAAYMGEGGSIPFMGMLGKKFPKAQFLITGVLGPRSNAHGPNEFLHIPTAKKLTAAIASVLHAHTKVQAP